MTLLLVDDSPDILTALRQCLRGSGVEVIGEARSVAEAIAQVATLSPQLVILDLQLPDGSGLDVLRLLRNLSPRPVILIFSINVVAKEACLREGADFFFDKTSELQELQTTVRRLATRKHD